MSTIITKLRNRKELLSVVIEPTIRFEVKTIIIDHIIVKNKNKIK